MREPGGGTYAFDAANRLTGLVNAKSERTTWAYDALGRVTTLTLGNGATVTYAYDAASRVLGVRNAKSDGTAISSFQYSVDDVGNPTGMVLANGDRVTWTYDSLYRLTREQRDGSIAYDITYTYDLSSNRLTKVASGVTTTYAYDEADRLLTENAAGALTTYSWDDAGNNTLMQAVGGTTTMTWDCENRLRTIQIPGGSVVTNTYGADGLRRKREEGSATVKYVWDGQRLLLESNGADATQALYTAGLGVYGPIVSMRRGAASRFLHPDHLGSIWNLTDASGDVTDSYLFDAWGNVLASSGSTTNPLQYVGALGYYREPAMRLDYVRARWLRPNTGSWLSVDPVPGERRYGYAHGVPTAVVDAGGRFGEVGPSVLHPEQMTPLRPPTYGPGPYYPGAQSPYGPGSGPPTPIAPPPSQVYVPTYVVECVSHVGRCLGDVPVPDEFLPPSPPWVPPFMPAIPYVDIDWGRILRPPDPYPRPVCAKKYIDVTFIIYVPDSGLYYRCFGTMVTVDCVDEHGNVTLKRKLETDACRGPYPSSQGAITGPTEGPFVPDVFNPTEGHWDLPKPPYTYNYGPRAQ